MKRLILKELREHVKVTLLGLAILTVILIYGFMSSVRQAETAALAAGYSYGSGNALQPLLAEELLVEVSIFCAIFAALLGWLQIRAERHPDLWAFLVHRPLPRTQILWSKVIAGLILYALGAGLPLLALVVVVLIPGSVAAPFAWAMTLPGAAIFLAGIAYYLSGLLTGLRRARWYASRGFGLGLAITANLALFAVPEFWQALLIIVIAGAVLAVAVWGNFQTAGDYREQPMGAKLALTIACTASSVLLLAVVFAGGSLLFSSRTKHSFSHYELTKDGTVYKVTQSGFGVSEIVDLNGKPLIDEKTGAKIKWMDFQRMRVGGWSALVSFDSSKNRDERRYLDGARFFVPWRVFDKTLWYLTAEGRLVAYHGVTRSLIGHLEPKEASNTRSGEQFRFLSGHTYLQPYSQPEVLASARTAYLVDLEKREVRPLFTVPSGDAIGGFAQNVNPFGVNTLNRALIVTRDSIRLLDFEGKTLLQVPYAPSYPTYSSVNVFSLEPTNRFAVRLDPNYWLNKKSGGKLPTHVAWVTGPNSITNTADLPILPEPQSQEGFIEHLLSALLPPAVPVYLWDHSYQLWTLLRIVLAGICAWAGWWLGRRNNLSLKAKIGWALFHLLFGIPALLAFLSVQEWPAREPCPNCRKLRAVDREQCEHCGAAFPPPEKTGIEIFEPLTSHGGSVPA